MKGVLTAIDVCAGAGGLSLGLHRAGFIVHGVEHDRAAHATHVANVGPCDLADATTWHPKGSVDLVAGGVPCQPFSTQGRRQGLEESVGSLFPMVAEPRAQLYRHLIRIAHEANASAVVLENVKGLLERNGGVVLHAIEEEMRAAQYAFITHRVLDAADFGVPQHRKRLFVVAFASPAHHDAFRWPEPTNGPGCPEPFVTTSDALAPGPRLAAELEAAGLLNRPSTTIVAAGGRVARTGHKEDGDQWNGCARLTVSQCAALQGFPNGFRWPKTAGDAFQVVANAVPPRLAEVVGDAVRRALLGIPLMSRAS